MSCRVHRFVGAWPEVVSAVVGALTVIVQLAQPHALTGVHGYDGRGYDDGVYFSASMQLMRGVFPYADFDHLHPTGLPVLLLPFALLDLLVPQQWAFAAARFLMVLVVAGIAFLGARLVRFGGTTAALTTGLAIALYPNAVTATHTILLEPYLVFFCLLGAVLLFDGPRVASHERILWAGIAFGCAGSIKVWAAVVALPAAVVVSRVGRVALGRFVTGLALGFGVLVVPLALASPRGFVDQVLLAQIGRGTNGVAEFSFGDRLSMVWGFEFWPDGSRTDISLWLFGLFVTACALAIALQVLVGRRRFQAFDAWAWSSAVVVLLAMQAPAQFYDHYAYFVAPFLAIVLGLMVASVVDVADRWLDEPSRRWVAPFVVVAAAGMMAPTAATRSVEYVRFADDPGAVIAAAIPVGSCVVSDMPTLLIVADRASPGSRCPAVNDPFGLWLTDNDGQPSGSPPPYDADFRSEWHRWFEQADFVVLSVPQSSYIPWGDGMVRWFDSQYRLVAQDVRAFVYQRVG